MKKALMGIGLILFAILLQLCSSGMEILTLGIGVVGLIITIAYALRAEK